MHSVVNVITRRQLVRVTPLVGQPGATVRVTRVGIQGPPGPPGPAGGSSFVWSPPSAQNTWAIAHNLNRYPSVTVTDSTGRTVYPDVTYLDSNLIQLSFAFAMQGTAYLN